MHYIVRTLYVEVLIKSTAVILQLDDFKSVKSVNFKPGEYRLEYLNTGM